MKGDTDNDLGSGDEEKFQDYVAAACEAVNSFATNIAISLACVMKRDRLARAKQVLMIRDSEKLISHLREPMLLPRSWLNGVCERLGVRLCRGQEFEMARRLWCTPEEDDRLRELREEHGRKFSVISRILEKEQQIVRNRAKMHDQIISNLLCGPTLPSVLDFVAKISNDCIDVLLDQILQRRVMLSIAK